MGDLIMLTDVTEKRAFEKRILDLNAELQEALALRRLRRD